MKTQSIIRSALVAIVAAGAAVTVAVPAAAEDNTVSVHIPVSRFNLAKPADQRAILWKIRAGARQVCGVSNGGEINQAVEVRRCFRDAMKAGAEQLAGLEASHGTMLAQLEIKGSAVSK
jgi:UrcA family protein